jgi:hypothetical protein
MQLLDIITDNEACTLFNLEAGLSAMDDNMNQFNTDQLRELDEAVALDQQNFDEYNMWCEEMCYKSDEFVAPTFAHYMESKNYSIGEPMDDDLPF